MKKILIFLFACVVCFAQQNQPIRIIVEAEDMDGVNQKAFGPGKSWQIGRWGHDLYQNMTFGGVWASRLRTAMTDEKANPAEIKKTISVPEDRKYKLWVKYECPPYFNYAFKVKLVDSQNNTVFDKIYGLITSEKHYCFTDKPLRGSLYWQWGIDHDAAEGYVVELKKGTYTLIIAKTHNPEPAGVRSIDVIMLTSDLSEISSPRYSRYPLLDELRRANHVYFRFRNLSDKSIKITWNHWNHRYPDFYAPFYRDLVRFYDEKGNLITRQDMKYTGDWPDPVEPAKASVWYDLGPTMNTESTSPYTFEATTVDGSIKNPRFAVDIALEPNEKKILKSFEIAPGEEELTILVQPDLNTKQGLQYTKKIVDIFKEITQILNKEKRLGPIPKKLKLFAYTGKVSDARNSQWGFEVEQAFRHALGLNTFSHVNDGEEAKKIIDWWKDRGGMIERSYAFHHSQDIPKTVKMIKDKKLEPYFYYLSYGDEIGLPSIKSEDPKMIEDFRKFVQKFGETPQSLGCALWEQVKPVSSPSTEIAVQIGVVSEKKETAQVENTMKKLYWYSVLFQEDMGIKEFAEKTRQLKKELGENVHTTANLGGMHPFYWVHQQSFIEAFKRGAMSLAWSEDYTYCMPEASTLVVDFLASYLRKGASYHDTPMQFYCMPHWPGCPPDLLLKNAVLLWANNVKDLDFFSAGIDAYMTENYIAYRGGLPTFKTIRTISGMAGLIEDYLIPARPEKTPVAMLLSQASDVWELEGKSQWDVKPGSAATNIFQEERKNIWYCLRKAGYRVDFITENDIKEGLLDNYRVLYIVGQNIEKKAAQKIKEWIENGGIVFATASAGRKDEFDQPTDVLDSVFGRGKQISYLKYKGPLRAQLELLFQSGVDRILFEGKSSKVLCNKEVFEVMPESQVVARYSSDGMPAWIKKNTGSGVAYYGGTLPGQTYIQAGLEVLPCGKGGMKQKFCHFGAGNQEPVIEDAVSQDLILLPLKENNIQPDIISSIKGIVTGRLKSDKCVVIPVVNLTARDSVKNVCLDVKGLEFVPYKVWSCFYKNGLKFSYGKEVLKIYLPRINAADVIIIE
ncbi:MAG: beta-galactosidase trimerization domain-containing protein [Candidatus Omnitrophica bacterium]|nr:beta-galactosidase trimerization domain-containing protein [Candidatus Omnitrophota bacterium]